MWLGELSLWLGGLSCFMALWVVFLYGFGVGVGLEMGV